MGLIPHTISSSHQALMIRMPRVFVGFSSTDIDSYRLMLAWKANGKIDFNFTNCQLHTKINSEDEKYIKGKCKERIKMASEYILLIGNDTRYKYKYVKWEAEVAIEKGCTIIGVNLNKKRNFDKVLCPPVIRDIGTIFVPFRPKIIAYALENYTMHEKGNRVYKDWVYKQLGYD